jgi:hypothetical protein
MLYVNKYYNIIAFKHIKQIPCESITLVSFVKSSNNGSVLSLLDIMSIVSSRLSKMRR